VAAHALGRAHHELGEVADACRVLADAADDAARYGLSTREGHVRNSLGLSLYTIGDHDGADRQLDRAEALLSGTDQARVVMQRAIIDVHRGRLLDGLARFNAALRPLESGGDHVAAARLVVSRGVAHSLLGNLDAAERDFRDGRQRALDCAELALAASAEANIAFVLGRRGDVPGSLEWFDRARESYATTGEPGRYLAILDCDLCEVLLLAGLRREATDAAHRAIEASRRGENIVQEAEAQLLLAHSLAASGDAVGSADAARSARDLFSAADRPTWALRARYAELLATSAATGATPSTIAEARAIADDLDAAGWSAEAARSRILAGRLLIERADLAAARKELAAAARARSRGTAVERADAWQATAMLRRAEGDRRGARRAVTAGLDVVERHRATLGATELRAGVSAHGIELARLGVEMALEDRRPQEVLRRVDRARGVALRFPPAKPPQDADLAGHLEQLRALDAERRAARLAGEPFESTQRRQAALEQTIRQRSRLARGLHDPIDGRLDVPRLRRALGDRVLVEYVQLGDAVHAVIVDRRRTVLHDLASADDVTAEVDAALFGLRRLITGVAGPVTEAMRETVRHATARLSSLLLGPLDRARELVIVPSPLVRSVPWSLLTDGRTPVTVTPSAATWLRPPRPLPNPRRVAVIAGPALPAATAEARAVAAIHPDSDLLEGAAATAAATLAACSRADLMHVASHGYFRDDSPLFSSLELADGPLTLYDIERLPRVPHTVVLSACDAATTGVPAGDEVVGTAMTLIGIGVRAVIAPLLPVSDDGAGALMVDVHRRLRAGDGAAHALARATEGRRGRRGALDAATFVCIATDIGT